MRQLTEQDMRNLYQQWLNTEHTVEMPLGPYSFWPRTTHKYAMGHNATYVQMQFRVLDTLRRGQ